MTIDERFSVVLVFTSLKSVQHKSSCHVVPNCIFIHNNINFVFAVDPAVFISYNWGKGKENQKTVKHLFSKLTEAGFHCWLDIEQMGGGDNWNAEIDEGIRASKVTRFRIFKHRCYRLKLEYQEKLDSCISIFHITLKGALEDIPFHSSAKPCELKCQI